MALPRVLGHAHDVRPGLLHPHLPALWHTMGVPYAAGNPHQQVSTRVFRIHTGGTIQNIPSNNIDFLNSAPGVEYRKLWY